MARVGVKVFFTINPSDLPALRRAMGTDHGRQFKRESSGGHPPAIELYLSNRYFAVTGQPLPDSSTEIRQVSRETLLWLIEKAGPAFVATAQQRGGRARRAAAPTAVKRRDRSRSAVAFPLAGQERRRGASYEQMKAVLLETPATAEWTRTKGVVNGERELRRAWDRATARHGAAGLRKSRPTIRITAGDLPDLVDRAEEALLETGADLYQRGSLIVRLGVVSHPTPNISPPRSANLRGW